jgi:hypothetical protein
MSPQFWPRLGGTFALGLAALVADRGAAVEPPAPLPVLPAVHTEPAAAPQPQPEIERFHGTVRVNPMTPPVAPAMRPPAVEMVPPPEPPILQVEARTPVPVAPAPVPETRVTDAVVDTLATVREDTRRVSTAAAVLLGQVGNWMKAPTPHTEPRAIFPITVSVPAPVVPQQPGYYPQVPPWAVAVPGSLPTFPPHAVAPASAAVPQHAAPLQPTIIVVREPAPPAPAQVVAAPVAAAPVEAPRPAFAPETLLGFGVGALGLGVGLMGWLKSSRKKPADAAAATFDLPNPATRPLDGVVLSNGLYAGPRPDLAEKFDLGPSYHDEQEQKKQQEAENQTAVLEFILAQNLALQAAFAGPTDGTPAAVGE